MIFMADMEILKAQFDELESQILGSMKEELNARGVGGPELYINRVLDALK